MNVSFDIVGVSFVDSFSGNMLIDGFFLDVVFVMDGGEVIVMVSFMDVDMLDSYSFLVDMMGI